jgi:hypothetical protein
VEKSGTEHSHRPLLKQSSAVSTISGGTCITIFQKLTEISNVAMTQFSGAMSLLSIEVLAVILLPGAKLLQSLSVNPIQWPERNAQGADDFTANSSNRFALNRGRTTAREKESAHEIP